MWDIIVFPRGWKEGHDVGFCHAMVTYRGRDPRTGPFAEEAVREGDEFVARWNQWDGPDFKCVEERRISLAEVEKIARVKFDRLQETGQQFHPDYSYRR